jgi:hypothetical protein
MAHDDMHQALREDDMYRVWFSVQNLLVALGNVSKLLWPAKTGMTERGVRLRETLAIDDSSPLADKNFRKRHFRNQFEHFDEKLDEWVLSSENLDYADSNVGTTPGKGVAYRFADEEYFRNIYRTDYPFAFALTLRGENFDLPPVIEAIRQLAARAKAESKDLPGRGRM